MGAMEKYETVDEYIANFTGEVRKRLNSIRAVCKQEISEGTEVISYGIPAIKVDGKSVIYFAGYPNHVSIYPLPKSESLKKEIEPYVAGKGTLRFPVDKSLPLELIRKVAQAKLVDFKERKRLRS